MTSRTLVLLVALGSIAAVASPTVALAGGTIVKLQGAAHVEHRGKRVEALESFPVSSGDLLEVAERGVAQLRFEDDSVFVVPGAAKFRVEEFTMPAAGKPGKAIYTLVDGGVRTITGSVKGAKGQYEMRTTEGTITVDGSAYSAMRCSGACARKHPGGLYVKAESGAITLTGSGGALKLKPGQIAFIPTGGGTPILVRVSPFNDPEIASSFNIDTEFDLDVRTPRIENENPASPS